MLSSERVEQFKVETWIDMKLQKNCKNKNTWYIQENYYFLKYQIQQTEQENAF